MSIAIASVVARAWLRVVRSVRKKFGVVSFSGGAQGDLRHGSARAWAGAFGAAGTLWRKGFGSRFAKRLTGSWRGRSRVGETGGTGLRVPNCGGRISGAVGAKRRAVGVQSM